jgi:predicted site-specific integrase-resolvase
MPELWNITKMCNYFQGMSAQTIRRWVREGKLPKPIKKLGTPFWDAEAIRKVFRPK